MPCSKSLAGELITALDFQVSSPMLKEVQSRGPEYRGAFPPRVRRFNLFDNGVQRKHANISVIADIDE